VAIKHTQPEKLCCCWTSLDKMADEYCCILQNTNLIQHSLLLVLSFCHLSLKAGKSTSANHSSLILYSYVNCIGNFSTQREEVAGQNLSIVPGGILESN
jgi:hypothetical protein